MDAREEDFGEDGACFARFVDGLHPGVVESGSGPAVCKGEGKEARRRGEEGVSEGGRRRVVRSVFEYLQTVRGKATAAKSTEYEDMKFQQRIDGMGEGREE